MRTQQNRWDVIDFTRLFLDENEVIIKKKEFRKPTCYVNGEKISRKRLGGMIFCYAKEKGMESNYVGIINDFGHQAFNEITPTYSSPDTTAPSPSKERQS